MPRVELHGDSAESRLCGRRRVERQCLSCRCDISRMHLLHPERELLRERDNRRDQRGWQMFKQGPRPRCRLCRASRRLRRSAQSELPCCDAGASVRTGELSGGHSHVDARSRGRSAGIADGVRRSAHHSVRADDLSGRSAGLNRAIHPTVLGAPLALWVESPAAPCAGRHSLQSPLRARRAAHRPAASLSLVCAPLMERAGPMTCPLASTTAPLVTRRQPERTGDPSSHAVNGNLRTAHRTARASHPAAPHEIGRAATRRQG